MADEEPTGQSGTAVETDAESAAATSDDAPGTLQAPPRPEDFFREAIAQQREPATAEDTEQAEDEPEPESDDSEELVDEIELDDDEEDLEDDELDDVEDDEDEEDEEEEPPAADRATTVPGEPAPYAAFIAQNPKRISEVPRGDREGAIRGAMALAYLEGQAAAVDHLQQQAEQAKQQGELESAIAERDRLKRDDPDAFADWAEEKPDEFDAYVAAKSQRSRNGASQNGSTPEPAAATPAATDIPQRAGAQFARLQQHPEAYQRISQKAAEGSYAADESGLAQLTRDVDAEIASLGGAAQAESTKKQRRRRAKERREKRTPAPVGGGSAPAPGAVEATNNPRELFAMASRQARSRAAS